MTTTAAGTGPDGTWSGAHLTSAAAEAGSRVALVYQGSSWTYAELAQWIGRAGRSLTARGVRRGDRVIMAGAPRPEAITAMFAVIRLGAILIPVHPQLTAGELAVAGEETSPRAVIGDEAWQQWPDSNRAGILHVTWDELTPTALPAQEDLARQEQSVDAPAGTELAIIALTSGTSGRPKAAALTHDNLRWGMANALSRLPVGPDDVTLIATPLAHVAVLAGLPQYTWARHGTVVLAPRFQPDLFIDLVRDHGVTAAFAVPAMLALLAGHPRFDTPDLDSLRWVLAGGAPALSAATTRFLGRGIGVINSYGLTEASAGVTYAAPDEVASLPASAGRPVPHVELRIADESGLPVPAGKAGEIWLRGPSVASWYWTHAGLHPATDADGWFRTGDRGRRDPDGRLEVIGRAKDTIITGGENVDPAEVENALTDLPGLREVAVCGTPDPLWGELVTAVIVAGPPEPSLDDIRAHLEGRLAKHKWPRRFMIVDALPRGATGKLQRRQLASLLGHHRNPQPGAGRTGDNPTPTRTPEERP